MEKEIEGYEDYTISEDGIVRSYKYKQVHIIKGFFNKGGYCYVDLCKNNQTKRFGIHQLVAKAFVEGWFEGAVVNHIDGNTRNNHYTNLEWTTQADNIKKGYITSGISATRNYCYHIIEYPNGECSPPLAGQQPIKDYIKDNNLDVSFNSLLRNGRSRGFKLHTLH